MRRWISTFLLAACCGSPVWAESSVWKVQKGDSVLYLGGTCHILRKTDYPLPPEFDRAYQASQRVIFETDLARLQEPALQQQLLERARYADGTTLDRHLSTNTYATLRAYCLEHGIPLQSFLPYKPSMLMVSLALVELSKLGVTQQGVDFHYFKQARQEGKPVEGLETAEQQIEYIVSMADGYEDEFVAYSLEDLRNIKEQFVTIADAWREGDARKLDELMVNELKTRWAPLYEKVIVARNQAWMPQVEALLETPETEFVLVGVGHLVGADGLLEALETAGYHVEQVALEAVNATSGL